MAKEGTYLSVLQTGLLAVMLVVLVPTLSAQNQLSFVVRSAEAVDVYLANSDSVAAMQLFIHLDGPGTFTGASSVDRTNGSGWQLPFNVTGTRDIRILLISANSGVLLPGSGSVVRLHLGKDLNSAADSMSLSFHTAILASSKAQALDVDTRPVTFKRTQGAENVVYLNNYPNPFNPTTRISFELTRNAEVELSIYDIQGRRIVELINRRMEAGIHTELWNGANEQGILLPSGLYICRVLVDGISTARKMILAK
jgi:hypothetical protein